ncbi:hypothetical protein HDU76_010144, partial [Blyttiomyces sp. JEL0837]
YALVHLRFGHASYEAITTTLPAMGQWYNFSKANLQCPICELCKAKQKSTGLTKVVVTRILYQLCEDVIRLPVETLNRKCYYLLIRDQFSGYLWIKFLCYKSEAQHVIAQFIKDLEAKHKPHKVVQIRSDGEELRTTEFQEFCDSHQPNWTEWQPSPAATESLNGAIEHQIGRHWRLHDIVIDKIMDADDELVEDDTPSVEFLAWDNRITTLPTELNTPTQQTTYDGEIQLVMDEIPAPDPADVVILPTSPILSDLTVDGVPVTDPLAEVDEAVEYPEVEVENSEDEE